MAAVDPNIHQKSVESFGQEWAAFDQTSLSPTEHKQMFNAYFRNFPLAELGDAEGFDLGCGSGRWAAIVAPLVRRLHCIDPSAKALAVCRGLGLPNALHHEASASSIPLADGSQGFGYALGVLHHIPDPAAALAAAVRKLKPGAPFLLYVYYDFENRPRWFRLIWKATDIARRMICRLPFRPRRTVTDLIAALVYWPLARLSGLLERMGRDPSWLPLSIYRGRSFYTMRTDALDRFGTTLEARFSRRKVVDMMRRAGLTDITINSGEPYWVAQGRKAGHGAASAS